jgi:hypothetical protein
LCCVHCNDEVRAIAFEFVHSLVFFARIVEFVRSFVRPRCLYCH